MSKGIENNTSIKDFVTILDKQVDKLKNTNPPQELKGAPSKATKLKDTSESNKVNTPKTMPMQSNDKNSKTKDLTENTTGKVTTQHNSNNIESDDKHKGVTAKRKCLSEKSTGRKSWEKTKGHKKEWRNGNFNKHNGHLPHRKQ